MPSEQSIFATLQVPSPIWAVGAIHGEAERLALLHRQISQFFIPGEKLVYLGNYSGRGRGVRECIDEVLLFRRRILATPEAQCADVVFLRGSQEEMWQKLLQLQFAPNPAEVLQWMVSQGIETTLEAYGTSVRDGMIAAQGGTLSLTRWTGQLRQTLRAIDGHGALMSNLRHAAATADGSLLFVHAGIDARLPLDRQGDAFWWGNLADLDTQPYDGFRRVIRGFDRQHRGLAETDFTLCLDAGCGFGGELAAAQLSPEGQVLRLLRA